MLGIEIKEKIDQNNRCIEKLITPSVFTLNNTVKKLLEENEKLQQQCPHEYKNGYCVYCYEEE